MYISKINQQVQGIELASQKHSQLFFRAKKKVRRRDLEAKILEGEEEEKKFGSRDGRSVERKNSSSKQIANVENKKKLIT